MKSEKNWNLGRGGGSIIYLLGGDSQMFHYHITIAYHITIVDHMNYRALFMNKLVNICLYVFKNILATVYIPYKFSLHLDRNDDCLLTYPQVLSIVGQFI